MNYKECTIEELVEHILSASCQAVTQQLTYHKKRGNQDIVDKIGEARKIAQKRRLLMKLESLG